MITKEDLFQEKHIELFMPDGIEFIYNILENICHSKDFKSTEVKREGLNVISILCDLDIIEVFHWGKLEPNISKTNFSKEDLINFVEKVWFEGANTQDFYSMPMFTYKKWYLDALEKKGLTIFTHWKTFVKEEIGDLEKWIEEVRP
jgi:hypothetical protein